jgi:hypothetical protein
MKKINLSQGKIAIVDDEDFEWLNQWKWHFAHGYAVRHYPVRENRKRPLIQMQNVIMNTPKGMETDHINHNRLDNQRHNLRICNHGQNSLNRKVYKSNTSGHKGVIWYKDRKRWGVQINFRNERIHLGFYKDMNEAINIRNNKAKELFGEFASEN